MNRNNILTCATCFLALFFFAGCNNNSKIEFLKSFGTENFNKDKWHSGTELQRAKMIYNYVDNNKPITQINLDELRQSLGNNTAYYRYDSFPAYYISTNYKSEIQKYIIAFVIDHKTRKVTGIYIDKCQNKT